jgi:hypothetical protein
MYHHKNQIKVSSQMRGDEMIQLLTSRTHQAIKVTLVASIIILGTVPVMGFDQVNTNFFGVAIKGYDSVAYHTENRAIKGSSKFSHEWNDAKWYFVSADNRDLFAADPERFAPQYGGY